MSKNGRIFDSDPPLLNRRHQIMVPVTFLPQNRREQLNNGVPADGLALIQPLPVTGNHDINVSG
eukprot:CAMPEP_0114329436 /NCGR_PEP_ID=MMETSP0101-20121206/1081_1 /TAXON_ID=38822 ORGANISM="Pteridomonas danica, Strain PT" /NCGR_SAMPLE_ID=MMETSP0101 /ASSEMBLY_ACC=CAM_ASM_000211 /LENGTH=63 /DNA_ID=CAMNT_0001459109 /DNA_START=222 /DNA_END=409 /DNA_ORIENTATION=+